MSLQILNWFVLTLLVILAVIATASSYRKAVNNGVALDHWIKGGIAGLSPAVFIIFVIGALFGVVVTAVTWSQSGIKVQTEFVSLLGSENYEQTSYAVYGLRANGWLTDGTLQGANLSEANLRDLDLRNADLQRANLSGVNLRRANLWSANLQGATLVAADLEHALLAKANLENVNLAGTNLMNVNFSGANLQGAILVDSTGTGMGRISGTTTLPDGSKWTPATDMGRFTDPNHPDFWRSDDPTSPAYHGQ